VTFKKEGILKKASIKMLLFVFFAAEEITVTLYFDSHFRCSTNYK